MNLNETTARKTAQQIKAAREFQTAVDTVRAIVPPCELWAQLAEEATELAHATLKLRRSTGGANPTPVEPDDAFRAVTEELADVALLVHILQLDLNIDAIEETSRYKLFRWVSRLKDGVRI